MTNELRILSNGYVTQSHELANYLYSGGLTGGGIQRAIIKRPRIKQQRTKTVTEFKGFKHPS